MKKLNKKGFSLVELIIVIAIMAVLIGVLAPTYLGQVEKSKRSTDLQNAQEIATALAIGAAQNEVGDGGSALSECDDVDDRTNRTKWNGIPSTIAVSATQLKSGTWKYFYDGTNVYVGIDDGSNLYQLYPSVEEKDVANTTGKDNPWK